VFGTWRPVFIIVGALGLVWLILFRWVYHPPQSHPWISDEERQLILGDRQADGDALGEHGSAPGRAPAGFAPGAATTAARLRYRELIRLPQTWGIVIGKGLTDPVWFFITDWFAVFLAARGFPLEQSLLAFWVPFLAADAGNFLGGGLSSWLIKRGVSVGTARKWIVAIGGLGMSSLAFTVAIDTLPLLTLVFAIATCAYAALSTMILNLPADVYWPDSVATVSGLGGAGAGVGTIAATLLTGVIADRYSFEPIFIIASIIPLVAVAAVLTLVRNSDATRRGALRPI
jgi:ACS family hexuronate transporter-like MFS transporter